MPANKAALVTPVGERIDYALAYAFGVLANLAYYNDANFDDEWATWFGFTSSQTVVTPGNELPNYTKIMSGDTCVFAIAGTTHYLQMLDNIIYSAQTRDARFGAGRIHSFFAYVAGGLIPFITADLQALPTQTKVAFTGHSLGGAAAQLLADHFHVRTAWDVRNCIVFNSPKVGDGVYAQRSRAYGFWHIVNWNDPVSGLPTGYFLGKQPYFPHSGIEITEWEQRLPMFQVAPAEVINTRRIARAGFSLLDFDRFLKMATENWRNLLHETRAMREAAANVRRWPNRFLATAAALSMFLWINKAAHEMTGLLSELQKYRLTSGSMLDVSGPLTIQQHLATVPVEMQEPSAYERPIGLVDPAPFMTPTPPASPAQLPAPAPAGTRLEVVTVGEAIQVSTLTNSGIEPVAVTIEPPVDQSIATWNNAPRLHHIFRGPDRNLLEKAGEVLNAMVDRDILAMEGRKTAALSTRELMFDPAEEDLLSAFYAVRDQISLLLSLHR